MGRRLDLQRHKKVIHLGLLLAILRFSQLLQGFHQILQLFLSGSAFGLLRFGRSLVYSQFHFHLQFGLHLVHAGGLQVFQQLLKLFDVHLRRRLGFGVWLDLDLFLHHAGPDGRLCFGFCGWHHRQRLHLLQGLHEFRVQQLIREFTVLFCRFEAFQGVLQRRQLVAGFEDESPGGL